jgi:pilus assembly protein CpaE
LSQLTFVVFSDRPSFGLDLAAALRATGHAEVAAVVSEADELVHAVREHRPEGVFADLGLDPDGVLDLLDELPAPRPLLLVAGPQEDSALILRAMRLGAKEFFPPEPEERAVRAAVERVVLEFGSASVAKSLAPVIAVMGAKGGVGATFTACQLAATLQSQGGRTALVDLNLPLGDVALYCDVQPTYSLANVVEATERLDATSLRTILQPHRSGVQILAAPSQVEEAELVKAPHVERVLQLLRAEFDWVVLDVSRSWNESSIRALDLADQILLVVLLDVPTLSHARQHLALLKRLGHQGPKIRLVANRFSKDDSVSNRDFEQFLGKLPDARLPNDYRTALLSVNQGKLVGEVAARSAIHSAFIRLAQDTQGWCGLAQSNEPDSAGLKDKLRSLFGKGNHGAHQ